MKLAGKEHETLQRAIAALQATAGLQTVKVGVRLGAINHRHNAAAAVLTITMNGHKQRFVAEVKTIDRRIAVAQVRAQLPDSLCNAIQGISHSSSRRSLPLI